MGNSTLDLSFFDEEFFKTGAFYADPENDLLIIAKGVSESKTQEHFFIKDFFEDSYDYYYPKSLIKTELSKTLELIKSFNNKPVLSDINNFDHIYPTDFKNFMESNIDKVVLISKEAFKTKNFNEALKHFIYSALNFGDSYPYAYWNNEKGILGATPELLFKVEGDDLITFALAGTSKAEDDHILINSKKDLHEHNLVVRDIEEKLEPFCHNITTHKTHTVRFKDLAHLRTDIDAKINADFDIVGLTTNMSPTAALGGYPFKESLNFLKNTEYQKLQDKRIFGSSMGVITNELKTVLVMIRNLEWTGVDYFIQCGGGVVKDSILENELNEINLKRNIIKKYYL